MPQHICQLVGKCADNVTIVNSLKDMFYMYMCHWSVMYIILHLYIAFYRIPGFLMYLHARLEFDIPFDRTFLPWMLIFDCKWRWSFSGSSHPHNKRMVRQHLMQHWLLQVNITLNIKLIMWGACNVKIGLQLFLFINCLWGFIGFTVYVYLWLTL